MLAYLVVQLDFSLLEGPLSRFKANLVQSLYCILDSCAQIKCSVDNSIGTDTKDFSQLDASSKDLAKTILRSASTT